MDTIVLVLGVIIAIGMMGYFFIVYRNQRIDPDRAKKLQQEFYDALIEGGVKDVYNNLDDVPLMDEYRSLKKEVVARGHIAKQLEINSKQRIIEEIFEKRGIELS